MKDHYEVSSWPRAAHLAAMDLVRCQGPSGYHVTEETAKGLDLLNKALELDPSYPLALALAAGRHAQGSVYNWAADIEASKREALGLAERAAALSVDDPLIITCQ